MPPNINCFKVLITGESQLKEEPSTPFLCSACVDFFLFNGLKSDFLFKNSSLPPRKCWICCDEPKIPQEAKKLSAHVKFRFLLFILYRFILFYLFPLLRYLIDSHVCSGPHPTFYLFYLNFSCSYRRAPSSV